jgi:hypothetical protein
VLFPGGLLPLKVFEARYLDLVSRCLRTRATLRRGAACRQGAELRGAARASAASSGGRAGPCDEVDAEQPGILRVRCTGGLRFRLGATAAARRRPVAGGGHRRRRSDAAVAGPAMLQPSVKALGRAIESLRRRRATTPSLRAAPAGRRRLGGQPLVRDAADLRWPPSRS